MNIEKALFNLQRIQVLQNKINSNTSSYISNAYAYAWEVSLFPLLDYSEVHLTYENQFSISKKEVDVVTEFADKKWLDKEYLSFYEYEAIFVRNPNPPISSERSNLISIFRYMFLRDAFDKKFWDVLVENGNCPIEAFSIVREFDVSELSLL